MRSVALISLFILNGLVLAWTPLSGESAEVHMVLSSRKSTRSRNNQRKTFDCGPDNIPKYSSVVVFGASYADNAHPRPAELNFTLKGPPYFEGRYCNGPVFDEYTAASLGAKLVNYAYGGAHSNNALTPGSVPSTRDQLKQYIADIDSGRLDRGADSVLHVWWIGINPLKAIVSDALAQGVMKGNGTADRVAEDRVDAQIAEVIDQVQTVRNNAAVQQLPSNIILLPIPPFEIIPDTAYIATSSSGNDTALVAPTTAFLKKISLRYNRGLMRWARLNGSPTSDVSAPSGWVVSPDIPRLYKDMFRKPKQFDFIATSTPCLNDKDGSICKTPAQYVQWDMLHPTTRTQEIIGDMCTKASLQCYH